MNELVKDWDLTKIVKEIEIIQGNREFVVVDIETLGFHPTEKGGIIEIAAVKIRDGVVDRFHSFVNPEERIPKKITKITGITDKMVKHAPKINTVLWAFYAFLGDAVVVCHNAKFDWVTFLKPLMQKALIQVNNPFVCTFQTYHRAKPGLGKGAYTNDRMALLFGYCLTGAHRADRDVEATAHTLMGLKRWFDQLDTKAIRQEIQQKELKKQQVTDKTTKSKSEVEDEIITEDTPVVVKEVHFWEKTFGKTKHMKRHYIKIKAKNEEREGTVFYDHLQCFWRNKDFPGKLNFNSVERDVLHFLGLKTIQEFEMYRN